MSSDLGLLKKKRFETILQLFLFAPNTITDSKFLVEKAKNDFDHAEKLFSKAIELSRTQKINKDLSALWKSDLADLFVSYDKAYFLPRKKSYLRFDETVRLYTEAISDFDVSGNKSEDLILPAVFQLAELLLFDSRFEEALPLYQRFVKSTKIIRNNSHQIISALHALASIFVMIDNRNEATETIAKLASLSGETNKISPSDFNLVGRVVIPQENKGKILANLQKHDYFQKRPHRNNPRQTDSITNSDIYLTRFAGVQVNILVDETGKVVEAKGKSKNAKENRKAEAKAAKLVFKPFIYNGVARKMRGYIVYEYTRND